MAGVVAEEGVDPVVIFWLILAALCLLAGCALLVVDRRRAGSAPAGEPPPSEGEDLFTPEALPRDPDD